MKILSLYGNNFISYQSRIPSDFYLNYCTHVAKTNPGIHNAAHIRLLKDQPLPKTQNQWFYKKHQAYIRQNWEHRMKQDRLRVNKAQKQTATLMF